MEKFSEKLNVKLFVLKDSNSLQVSKSLKYLLFFIYSNKIKIDFYSVKRRHFHFCNNDGIWQKPAKVVLFCITNGELNQYNTYKWIQFLFEVEIAEELRLTRENNDQFQEKLNILDEEVKTCENDIAEIEIGSDHLQQEYDYYKNETDKLTQMSSNCVEEPPSNYI